MDITMVAGKHMQMTSGLVQAAEVSLSGRCSHSQSLRRRNNFRWLTYQVTAALRIGLTWRGGWRRRWRSTQRLRCWWTTWRTTSTRILLPGPSDTSLPRRVSCYTNPRTGLTTPCLTKAPYRTSSRDWSPCFIFPRLAICQITSSPYSGATSRSNRPQRMSWDWDQMSSLMLAMSLTNRWDHYLNLWWWPCFIFPR